MLNKAATGRVESIQDVEVEPPKSSWHAPRASNGINYGALKGAEAQYGAHPKSRPTGLGAMQKEMADRQCV